MRPVWKNICDDAMKIVVTGALGHIGSRVIRALPERYPGIDIVMLDNLSAQRYCSLFHLPSTAVYRFIEADVLTTDLAPIVEGADAVLHLAAITDAAASFQHREQVEYVNYTAAVKVAEACCVWDVPLIHLSSTSVYGTQRDLVDEDCSENELRPQSPYAETKLKEERFLQSCGASKNLRFVTCRFGTICGTSPGMRFHTAVNKFCWQAVMGQPVTVWRTALHQKRPYLTLDDAVRVILFILEHHLFDRRIYNVLTANLTVHEILQAIKRDIPQLELLFVDTEIMNQLSYEVSSVRIKHQGFDITGSVERNIAETIALLKNAGGKA